jgi:hypothetical protein
MDECHVVIIEAAAGGIDLPRSLAASRERVPLRAGGDWLRAPPRPPMHLYQGRNPGARLCGSGRVAGVIWGGR